MIKKIIIATVAAGVTFGGGWAAAEASTPKPSGYCSVKELGKKVKYTTPSGSATYYLICKKVPTQKWKKA